MDLLGLKIYTVPYCDAAALKTLFVFTVNGLDTSADVFEELLCKNSLLNIQRYAIPEVKRQGNDNFELSINEIKAFLG